jgi:hypothetical protein
VHLARAASLTVSRPLPRAPQTFDGRSDPKQQIAINGPAIQLESELFSGKMQVHLRGLPSTQKQVFDGKKRFFHIMVQVRLSIQQ